MEKRFRVLVAFYGVVVLVMMASRKSEAGNKAAYHQPESKIAAWDKLTK